MAKEKTEKRKVFVDAIVEGRKLEAYAEHRTKDMRFCWFCERIAYRKLPGKEIGRRWVCIDCFAKLKEILDTLKQWEEEITLASDVKKQLDKGLGLK